MTDTVGGYPTEAWVDGNALAGALQELFAVEVTTVRGRCAGCGRVDAVATARVYQRSAGAVALCPSCGSVLMRLVQAPGRVYLDLHGMTFLELRSAQ